MNDLYEIYTDGGCIPNPGKGAWALVVVKNGLKINEKVGGESNTTNNRMEYIAVINALQMAKLMNVPMVIRSDSELLVKTYNIWIDQWAAQNWKRKSKEPIKNLDLVQDLFRLKREIQNGVIVKWVKGHNGNQWNEYCDDLCGNFINSNYNMEKVEKSFKRNEISLTKLVYYCSRIETFLNDNCNNVEHKEILIDSLFVLKEFFTTELTSQNKS